MSVVDNARKGTSGKGTIFTLHKLLEAILEEQVVALVMRFVLIYNKLDKSIR